MKTDGNLYFLVILLNIIVIQEVHSECSESTNWTRELTLDDKGHMIIKWNFTNDILTMMMIGRTKGYISVGFAPMKEMKEADIIVGWIQKGKPYLQDRWSSKGEEPILDNKQSLTLLGGKENNTHTTLCFQRTLNTCDQQDFNIQNGTVNIVWALSTNDPYSETGNLQYLSTKRGIRPVYMLSVVFPKPASKGLEYFDISPRKNVIVKGDSSGTLYWCTNYKFPPFDSKRFIMGYELLIPQNSKDVTHHVILYLCKRGPAAEVYDKIDPNGYNCINSASSKYKNPCNTVLAMWSRGTEHEYFPEKIGILFGSETENFYVKTEVHYAIPKQKQGITDNSTIRLFLSKHHPKFEAGIFSTGMEISPIHLIPPRQKAFSTVAICGGSCLQQTFSQDGFINIIAVRFHFHLSGKKMRIHVFRNNTKLTTLSEEHFDFNFQGFQYLPTELKILSTDIMVTECIYDTSDRTATTIGSASTEEEMCAPTYLFYPFNDLSWCMSFPDKQKIFNLTGIQEVRNSTQALGCEGNECQTVYLYPGIGPTDIIVKPPESANQTLQDHMKKFKWTQQRIGQLKDIYYLPQTPVCIADFTTLNAQNLVPLELPPSAKLIPSSNQCAN